MGALPKVVGRFRRSIILEGKLVRVEDPERAFAPIGPGSAEAS